MGGRIQLKSPRIALAGILVVLLAALPFGVGHAAAATLYPQPLDAPAQISATGVNGTPLGIAVDASGTQTAVWLEGPFNAWQAFAARRGPSGNWSTPTKISGASTIYLGWQVVAAPGGTVFAFWAALDGARHALQVARYEPSSGWIAPVTIDNASLSDSDITDAAATASGGAFVAFRQVDGSLFRVYVVRYEPGTGWGAPLQLSADNGQPADGPTVAVSPSGDAVVAWHQLVGTQIQAVFFDNGSGWSPVQPVGGDSGVSTYPDVAIAGDSRVYASWRQHNNTTAQDAIWFASAEPGGLAWGEPEMIRGSANQTVGAPHIAIGATGPATIVWNGGVQSFGGGFHELVQDFDALGARCYFSGCAIAHPLEATNDSTALDNSVSAGPDGTIVAGWEDRGSSGTQLRFWIMTPEVGGGLPTSVPPRPGHFTGVFKVAIAADGDGVLMWQSWDTHDTSVWVSTISLAQGPTVLELSLPASGTETAATSITIVGRTVPGWDVSVENATVTVDAEGAFSATVPLSLGQNAVHVSASTLGVAPKTLEVSVFRTQPPPDSGGYGMPLFLTIAIVVAAAVVLAIALLAARRKRAPPSQP